MFSSFSLITSKRVVSEEEFRENTLSLATSNPGFMKCLSTQTHNLKSYETMLRTLFSMQPGEYLAKYYASKDIDISKLASVYKSCNGNIENHDRHVVDETLRQYKTRYVKFDFAKKRNTVLGRSIFDNTDGMVPL